MNSHYILGIPGPLISTISKSHNNPCIISILIYFPRGLETGSIFQNYIWTQIDHKPKIVLIQATPPLRLNLTFSPLTNKAQATPNHQINLPQITGNYLFPNCFLYMGLVQQETFTCLYECSSSWLKDGANKYNLFDL